MAGDDVGPLAQSRHRPGDQRHRARRDRQPSLAGAAAPAGAVALSVAVPRLRPAVSGHRGAGAMAAQRRLPRSHHRGRQWRQCRPVPSDRARLRPVRGVLRRAHRMARRRSHARRGASPELARGRRTRGDRGGRPRAPGAGRNELRLAGALARLSSPRADPRARRRRHRRPDPDHQSARPLLDRHFPAQALRDAGLRHPRRRHRPARAGRSGARRRLRHRHSLR